MHSTQGGGSVGKVHPGTVVGSQFNPAQQRMLEQHQQQMVRQQQEAERSQQMRFEQEQKAVQQKLKVMMPDVKRLSQEFLQARANAATAVKNGRRLRGYVIGPPYWWTVWPRQERPRRRPQNLTSLKTTLDTIATTRKPIDSENVGFQKVLYSVHNPEMMYPAEADVEKLANDLTTALISRGDEVPP